jgi:hypothetical protein
MEPPEIIWSSLNTTAMILNYTLDNVAMKVPGRHYAIFFSPSVLPICGVLKDDLPSNMRLFHFFFAECNSAERHT